MNDAEIAALIGAGKTAAEIAVHYGVHLRTAYKYLTRAKPTVTVATPTPAPTPKGYDRLTALDEAIDRCIIGLGDGSLDSVDRLARLARAAKHLHAITPARIAAKTSDTEMHRRLIVKLSQAARSNDPVWMATTAAGPDAQRAAAAAAASDPLVAAAAAAASDPLVAAAAALDPDPLVAAAAAAAAAAASDPLVAAAAAAAAAHNPWLAHLPPRQPVTLAERQGSINPAWPGLRRP